MRYVSEMFKRAAMTQAKEFYQNGNPFDLISVTVDMLAGIEVAEHINDIMVICDGCRTV